MPIQSLKRAGGADRPLGCGSFETIEQYLEVLPVHRPEPIRIARGQDADFLDPLGIDRLCLPHAAPTAGTMAMHRLVMGRPPNLRRKTIAYA